MGQAYQFYNMFFVFFSKKTLILYLSSFILFVISLNIYLFGNNLPVFQVRARGIFPLSSNISENDL